MDSCGIITAWATVIYDILTFGLLSFAAYQTWIRPTFPNIAFYIQFMPKDTKHYSWSAQLMDFVLENRGQELKNIQIKSKPDDIGFGRLNPQTKPRKTSEYFKKKIPYLSQGAIQKFFWCELFSNNDVAMKPFKIIIEFDNPTPIYNWFVRRRQMTFPFDLTFYEEISEGFTGKYDIHNVAEELSRARGILEKIEKKQYDSSLLNNSMSDLKEEVREISAICRTIRFPTEEN